MSHHGTQDKSVPRWKLLSYFRRLVTKVKWFRCQDLLEGCLLPIVPTQNFGRLSYGVVWDRWFMYVAYQSSTISPTSEYFWVCLRDKSWQEKHVGSNNIVRSWAVVTSVLVGRSEVAMGRSRAPVVGGALGGVREEGHSEVGPTAGG